MNKEAMKFIIVPWVGACLLAHCFADPSKPEIEAPKVEKRAGAGQFIIEESTDSRGVPGIRFLRISDRKPVFEAWSPSSPWIGDGCIRGDGKYLAYSVGGGSAGHEGKLLARKPSGEYDEVDFNFETALVAKLLTDGLIPKGASPTHVYIVPLEFTGDKLILKMRGDYALAGKQKPFPVVRFSIGLLDKKVAILK